MNKIFKQMIILFGLAFFMSSVFAAEPIDGVAAVVNNEVITQQELNNAITGTTHRIAQSGMQMPPADVIKSKVLEQMILQKLQVQIAKRAKVTATEAEVDEAIANIAKNNHITVAELKGKVAQEGTSYAQFRDTIKNQIILNKVQREAVMSKVKKPTEKEVQAMYKQLQQQSQGAAQFHVLDVVIPTEDGSLAENIHAKMQQGANPEDITKQYSQTKFNDLGMQASNNLPEIFLSQLQTMRVGQVSSVIKAPNGFHVLKLVAIDKKAATQKVTLEQAKMMVVQQQFQKALQDWLAQLRQSAYVKITNS